MAFLLLTACKLVAVYQIGEDKVLVSDGVLFAACLFVITVGFGLYELIGNSYVRISIDSKWRDPP